jgi:hypothetical protein
MEVTKLSLFQNHVRLCNNGKIVVPGVIVTDFSYALMYACLGAVNNESFVEYLKRCFKIQKRQATKSEIKSKTFLANCNAHSIKALGNKLARSEKNHLKKKAVLVIYSGLQRTISLQATGVLYTSIHTSLCRQVEDNETIKARAFGQNVRQSVNLDDTLIANDDRSDRHCGRNR